jgi:hypothetical protein
MTDQHDNATAALLVAAELLAMANADQQMRTRALADTDAWDVQIDRANTARLKHIVGQIGWPTMSKVGREASSAAWLLVQHAPDSLDFMRHCLELMKQAEPREVKLSNIAFLEDRVRILQDEPQLYGTQFRDMGDGYQPFPIEDPDRVDERRSLAGLDTLAENVARIRELHSDDG